MIEGETASKFMFKIESFLTVLASIDCAFRWSNLFSMSLTPGLFGGLVFLQAIATLLLLVGVLMTLWELWTTRWMTRNDRKISTDTEASFSPYYILCEVPIGTKVIAVTKVDIVEESNEKSKRRDSEGDDDQSVATAETELDKSDEETKGKADEDEDEEEDEKCSEPEEQEAEKEVAHEAAQDKVAQTTEKVRQEVRATKLQVRAKKEIWFTAASAFIDDFFVPCVYWIVFENDCNAFNAAGGNSWFDITESVLGTLAALFVWIIVGSLLLRVATLLRKGECAPNVPSWLRWIFCVLVGTLGIFAIGFSLVQGGGMGLFLSTECPQNSSTAVPNLIG